MRETKLLGFVDNLLNDPRTHCLRTVYLRWVEQQPRPTDEIKLIVPVPLSVLRDLVTGRASVNMASGEQLSFILNHAEYIDVVMSHPHTQTFIANLKTQAAATARASYSPFGPGALQQAAPVSFPPSSSW